MGKLLFTFLLLSLNAAWAGEDMGRVEISVTGLSNVQGNIYISVYDSDDNWLGDDKVLEQKVVISEALKGDQLEAVLLLKQGEYALTIYYDANDNGVLDTNFFGLPKEPVALSNNAKPKFGPPKYRDAKFQLGAEIHIQTIDIEEL